MAPSSNSASVKLFAGLAALVWVAATSAAGKLPRADSEPGYDYEMRRYPEAKGLHRRAPDFNELFTKFNIYSENMFDDLGPDGNVFVQPPSRRSAEGCTSCDYGGTYQVLDKQFYPRKLFNRTCATNKACAGAYVCSPITYSVTVLENTRAVGCIMPECAWKPVEVPVTVACVCSEPGM